MNAEPTTKRYNGVCPCATPLSTVVTTPAGQIVRHTQWVNCANCNRRVKLVGVKGTYNPDHPCDARCTSAKGHVCTCSCGGANHGADHSGFTKITQVASVYKKPVSERVHIGTVGAHIKGEVTVEKVLRNVGSHASTLFVFVTSKGDVIKWFCPVQHTPDWSQGDTFILRAKVREHKDGEYGAETIVTYGEKVEPAQTQLEVEA
jgi:hypothetical protein